MANLLIRPLLLLCILLAGCSPRSDASISHVAASPHHASSKIDIVMKGVDRSMTLSFLTVDGEVFATLHSPTRTFYKPVFPLQLNGTEVTLAKRRKGKYIAKIEDEKALIDALLASKEHTLKIGIEEFTFEIPNFSELIEESTIKQSTALEF